MHRNLNTKLSEDVKSILSRIGNRNLKAYSPCYLYDKSEVLNNLRNFKDAFVANGVNISVFYAIKSNFYPGILRTIVKAGEGLDASSVRELRLALSAGAKNIIYTGPAKTEKDFKLIVSNHDKVTVNLESTRELRLLAKLAEKMNVIVRCGLRVVTDSQKGWTKFGQPLGELRSFYDMAKKLKAINFCGIHFHISMNKTPKPYVKTLNELSIYLTNSFSEDELRDFLYIDMGGGYYPNTYEGIYPWNIDQEIKYFSNRTILESIYRDEFVPRYVPIPSDPICKFGEIISKTFLKTIAPILPNVKLYAEPGRFISHSSMHMIVRLVEIKSERKGIKIGIADGGGNMIGWEKYQFCNYAPIFNLSQFDAKREIPFITYGSLCTPDDIWGYYLYTKGTPKVGDVLLMPFQGAYTYTLAQNFIKEIPKVYDL